MDIFSAPIDVLQEQAGRMLAKASELRRNVDERLNEADVLENIGKRFLMAAEALEGAQKDPAPLPDPQPLPSPDPMEPPVVEEPAPKPAPVPAPIPSDEGTGDVGDGGGEEVPEAPEGGDEAGAPEVPVEPAPEVPADPAPFPDSGQPDVPAPAEEPIIDVPAEKLAEELKV